MKDYSYWLLNSLKFHTWFCFSEPLPLLHRCVPKQLTSGTSSLFSGSGIENFGEELAKDFQVAKNELAQMGITALGLSVLITIAFR